jgi:hypothetical protein
MYPSRSLAQIIRRICLFHNESTWSNRLRATLVLSYFATMAPIDPQDADNSLEDCARLDQFVRTANSFHVKGDDKYTSSVECVVFMIVML